MQTIPPGLAQQLQCPTSEGDFKDKDSLLHPPKIPMTKLTLPHPIPGIAAYLCNCGTVWEAGAARIQPLALLLVGAHAAVSHGTHQSPLESVSGKSTAALGWRTGGNLLILALPYLSWLDPLYSNSDMSPSPKLPVLFLYCKHTLPLELFLAYLLQ